MEMKNKVIGALFFLLMFSLLLLGFGYGRDYEEKSISQKVDALEIPIEDYNQCRNLTFYNTSGCLVRYVMSFYNYTITLDQERTIEDIKRNGGDCYDYSNIYVKLGKELGFKTKVLRFEINDTDAHAVAILGNEKGYCLIDQINNPVCRFYRQDKKESYNA